jgi:hypothetical protein
MVEQKTGGSIVSISSSIVDHPLAVFTASVPMITKGGIDAISRSLAMEYAKQAGGAEASPWHYMRVIPRRVSQTALRTVAACCPRPPECLKKSPPSQAGTEP